MQARQGREIHLTLPGVLLPHSGQPATACNTRSRIVVRTGGTPLAIICPLPSHSIVRLVSGRGNWSGELTSHLQSVSVHLAGQSQGKVTFSWLEVTPDTPQSGLHDSLSHNSCVHHCPSLHGCISQDLWCDGEKNCPDGWDEAEEHCSHLLIPLHYLYFVAAGSVVLFTVTAMVVVCRVAAARSGDHEGAKRVSNGTVETMLNHKEEVS